MNEWILGDPIRVGGGGSGFDTGHVEDKAEHNSPPPQVVWMTSRSVSGKRAGYVV